MRETLRPVTLRRIIEVADLCSREDLIGPEEVQENLELSENRTREVIAEMERTSLIKVKDNDNIRLTTAGEEICEGFQEEDWQKVHMVLYQNSPHYRTFIDCLESHEGEYGLTEADLLERLDDLNEEISFNQTGIFLVTDWGERLGAVQRNVFEDRFYSVTKPRKDQEFVDILQREYSDMEVERGVNLKQRYVSIPEIRELLCEKLQITRDQFDEELVTITQENIGKMELSGAPPDTKAKESRFGIKTISKDEENGRITSQMKSQRVLDGVSLGDGKMYYYLAIFEQLMGDDSQ